MKKYLALFGCVIALVGCSHIFVPCSYYREFAEKPIYFKFGGVEFTDESKKTIDEGLVFLRNHRTKRIELDGYTDEVGNPDFNMNLSRRRVEAVRNYMIENGVAPKRIRVDWHGAEKGRPYSKHRRVDVMIK